MKYLRKNSEKGEKPVQEKYSLRNALANVYLLLMLALFPLFIRTTFDGNFPFIHTDWGFFSIRHDKYYYFLILTGVAIVAELLLLLTYSRDAKDARGRLDTRPLIKRISFTDWAAVALLIFSTVSTLFSPYQQEALLGAPYGRNNGLVLIVFYVAAYFFITRCYRYKDYVFIAMSVCCGLVYLIAALNEFYIDPLGMFSHFKSEHNMVTFITTIGNKNMFASFICVSLPAIILFSVHAERLPFKIIHLVSAFFGYTAIVVSDSDSALLGIGAFTAIFIAVYIRRIERLKNLFLAFTVMLLGSPALRFFSMLMGDKYKPLGQFPSAMIFSNTFLIALPAMAVITALLFLLDRKKPGIVLPLFVQIIAFVLVALGFAGGIGSIIYFSTIDTETNLGSLERLLRFNDRWGTHRGVMWIRAMYIFNDAPLVHKLFGYGPDTFYEAFTPYFSDLKKYSDGSTNAAHNEYINYLITIGIAGLTAYLAMVGGAIARAFRAAKRNPMALAFAAGAIAYLAQAVVNIALPITTPMFIIMIALCEATARREEVKALSEE